MRNFCRVAYLLAAVFAVSACVKPPKVPQADPNFELPKGFGGAGGSGGLGALLNTLFCDKPETASKLSESAHQQAVVFSDRIASQNREVIQPDGSSKISMAPTRHMIRRLVVMPPEIFAKVQAIEVENLRSCSKYTVVTVDQMLGIGGDETRLVPTQNDVTGKVELEIADITLASLQNATFVRDGVNAIEIRYMGECLVPGKNGKCVSRPVLATKMIEVDVEIERFEIPGMQPPVVVPAH